MRVGDEYRTNPLSHKAGGSIVQITFNNGSVREYDKVKYPESFIEKCFDMDNSIVSAKLISLDCICFQIACFLNLFKWVLL